VVVVHIFSFLDKFLIQFLVIKINRVVFFSNHIPTYYSTFTKVGVTIFEFLLLFVEYFFENIQIILNLSLT